MVAGPHEKSLNLIPAAEYYAPVRHRLVAVGAGEGARAGVRHLSVSPSRLLLSICDCRLTLTESRPGLLKVSALPTTAEETSVSVAEGSNPADPEPKRAGGRRRAPPG